PAPLHAKRHSRRFHRAHSGGAHGERRGGGEVAALWTNRRRPADRGVARYQHDDRCARLLAWARRSLRTGGVGRLDGGRGDPGRRYGADPEGRRGGEWPDCRSPRRRPGGDLEAVAPARQFNRAGALQSGVQAADPAGRQSEGARAAGGVAAALLIPGPQIPGPMLSEAAIAPCPPPSWSAKPWATGPACFARSPTRYRNDAVICHRPMAPSADSTPVAAEA